jgi:hypothetical protein
MTKDELLAVLRAYKEAITIAAPTLHPDMEQRSWAWSRANERELATELERCLRIASAPTCQVRVFFKLGEGLHYGGCNSQFAADAGLVDAADNVGKDDFDPSISWFAQAAKYRRDDRAVIEKATPMLGIIERQSSASGLIWLDTSKVPIVVNRSVIGVFGTYEIIDGKTASQRASARQR